jgi:hypothetical protein
MDGTVPRALAARDPVIAYIDFTDEYDESRALLQATDGHGKTQMGKTQMGDHRNFRQVAATEEPDMALPRTGEGSV